jgi:hypothetical protein
MPEGRDPTGDPTGERRRVSRWRYAATTAGVVAIGFGAWQLLSGGISTRPSSSLLWLAGSLLVHDGVFAPLVVLAGWALTRLLPGAARRLTAAALLVAGSLAIVAVPPLLAPGVRDNPTTTPRDYGRGLLAALVVTAVVTLAVAGVITARARLRRR